MMDLEPSSRGRSLRVPARGLGKVWIEGQMCRVDYLAAAEDDGAGAVECLPPVQLLALGVVGAAAKHDGQNQHDCPRRYQDEAHCAADPELLYAVRRARLGHLLSSELRLKFPSP